MQSELLNYNTSMVSFGKIQILLYLIEQNI